MRRERESKAWNLAGRFSGSRWCHGKKGTKEGSGDQARGRRVKPSHRLGAGQRTAQPVPCKRRVWYGVIGVSGLCRARVGRKRRCLWVW
jgi:hypothetical protein